MLGHDAVRISECRVLLVSLKHTSRIQDKTQELLLAWALCHGEIHEEALGASGEGAGHCGSRGPQRAGDWKRQKNQWEQHGSSPTFPASPPKLMAMGHCSRPSCFPGRRLLCRAGFLVAKPGDPLWVPRVMKKAAVAHGAPRPLQSDWSWPPLQSRFSQPDFLLGQLEACPEIDHKS